MVRLYDSPTSGNCYKVRLLLTQLQIPFETVVTQSRQGQTRTPEFLAKNPFGQVPIIELESGQVLAESTAILYYLAEGTPLFSTDAWERALILQWLAFEQTRLLRYVALNRFLVLSHQTEEKADLFQHNLTQGTAALQIMEHHLKTQDYFVGERYTIADLALFAYTHLAPIGTFDLSPFSHLQHWIERIQQQPHFLSFST